MGIEVPTGTKRGWEWENTGIQGNCELGTKTNSPSIDIFQWEF